MKTMSIEELDERVEELNGLFPEWSAWRQVRARKEHQDENGVEIEAGDWYYQRDRGFCVVRYSMTSMGQLILTLLTGNPLLKGVSKKVREKRMAEYCRATECLDC
jgi:hypothetical protein